MPSQLVTPGPTHHLHKRRQLLPGGGLLRCLHRRCLSAQRRSELCGVVRVLPPQVRQPHRRGTLVVRLRRRGRVLGTQLRGQLQEGARPGKAGSLFLKLCRHSSTRQPALPRRQLPPAAACKPPLPTNLHMRRLPLQHILQRRLHVRSVAALPRVARHAAHSRLAGRGAGEKASVAARLGRRQRCRTGGDRRDAAAQEGLWEVVDRVGQRRRCGSGGTATSHASGEPWNARTWSRRAWRREMRSPGTSGETARCGSSAVGEPPPLPALPGGAACRLALPPLPVACAVRMLPAPALAPPLLRSPAERCGWLPLVGLSCALSACSRPSASAGYVWRATSATDAPPPATPGLALRAAGDAGELRRAPLSGEAAREEMRSSCSCATGLPSAAASAAGHSPQLLPPSLLLDHRPRLPEAACRSLAVCQPPPPLRAVCQGAASVPAPLPSLLELSRIVAGSLAGDASLLSNLAGDEGLLPRMAARSRLPSRCRCWMGCATAAAAACSGAGENALVPPGPSTSLSDVDMTVTGMPRHAAPPRCCCCCANTGRLPRRNAAASASDSLRRAAQQVAEG